MSALHSISRNEIYLSVKRKGKKKKSNSDMLIFGSQLHVIQLRRFVFV
jgi:hypothetical protein